MSKEEQWNTKNNLAPVWEGADLDKSAGRRGQGLHCQVGGGAPGKVKTVRSFLHIWLVLSMFTWWTIGEGFFAMETMIDFVCFRSTYPGCRIPRHRGEHRRGKDICHWGTLGCSAPSSRGFPRHCHRCPPPSFCPPPPPQGPRCRTCCALWGAAGQQCLGLHCPDRYRLSGKLILSCLRVACIVFFVLPFFVHKLFLKLNIIYLGHI